MVTVFIIAVAIGFLTLDTSLYVALYACIFSGSDGYSILPYAVLSEVAGAAWYWQPYSLWCGSDPSGHLLTRGMRKSLMRFKGHRRPGRKRRKNSVFRKMDGS